MFIPGILMPLKYFIRLSIRYIKDDNSSRLTITIFECPILYLYPWDSNDPLSAFMINSAACLVIAAIWPLLIIWGAIYGILRFIRYMYRILNKVKLQK